jgi:hypothetical protein
MSSGDGNGERRILDRSGSESKRAPRLPLSPLAFLGSWRSRAAAHHVAPDRNMHTSDVRVDPGNSTVATEVILRRTEAQAKK